MRYWEKLTQSEINIKVQDALKKNVDFRKESIIGVPVSNLDEKVFNQNPTFLNEAPFLTSMVFNPNHIGCHTMGDSEAFFRGTQELERQLVCIVAEDILKGKPDAQDGYVASGGTEANMQAIWIYRNYFMFDKGASIDQIAILCSEDSHYSMPKAANIQNLAIYKCAVDDATRELNSDSLKSVVELAKSKGIKFFIVVSNMMTTMFGSVDNVDEYVNVLKEADVDYKIHVDGAYGGFVYPFAEQDDNRLNFLNPEITSFTLDAHKMVQAPYGTGMFVIRKGWMQYATTEEAEYVQGMDATIIGSRSGANAIAVWMILQTYGPHGWFEKIHILNYRTEWLCKKLTEMGVEFYRHPASNLVTMRAQYIPKEVVSKFGLVPDSHSGNARWYKIVVMEHVTIDLLMAFVNELSASMDN